MRKQVRQCLAENGINRLTMDAACRVTAQCPVVTRMITHCDAFDDLGCQTDGFPVLAPREFVDDRCLVELLGCSSTVLFELNAFGNDSFGQVPRCSARRRRRVSGSHPTCRQLQHGTERSAAEQRSKAAETEVRRLAA